MWLLVKISKWWLVFFSKIFGWKFLFKHQSIISEIIVITYKPWNTLLEYFCFKMKFQHWKCKLKLYQWPIACPTYDSRGELCFLICSSVRSFVRSFVRSSVCPFVRLSRLRLKLLVKVVFDEINIQLTWNLIYMITMIWSFYL